MTIKCKDCKHWQTDHNWYSYSLADFGVCGKIEHCDRDEQTDLPAAINDAEDYHAVLITLPDFGCVLAEEKGDPP